MHPSRKCQDEACRSYHNIDGEHLSPELQAQIEREQNEKAARRLAVAASASRSDCDTTPVVVDVRREPLADGTFVIEVDVRYSSKGYQALYGYRERDGDFCLYQD